MTYLSKFNQLSWDDLKLQISSVSKKQVETTLAKNQLSFDDFLVLISPAAYDYLNIMANKSLQLTRQRFGNTIQLFIPLYLSNKCANICSYCGYSLNNKITRKTLTIEEIQQEAYAIKLMGFDHILLVTGEAGNVGVDYFAEVIKVLRSQFSHISLESQPLSQQEYSKLHNLGLDAVFVYQETYNKECYKKHHIYGKKTNFDYRLDTPDRAGKAGIDKIGVGYLIGLSPDWRAEAAMVISHLDYLEKTYWKTHYSISLPRLRPATGINNNATYISNSQLLQLICAYRIYNPNVEISLSTRESPKLRDKLLPLGITSFSACSKTTPGGYANTNKTELEQFSIADHRSIDEIITTIANIGLDPIRKDWVAFDRS